MRPAAGLHREADIVYCMHHKLNSDAHIINRHDIYVVRPPFILQFLSLHNILIRNFSHDLQEIILVMSIEKARYVSKLFAHRA